jgi:hypothetical protein
MAEEGETSRMSWGRGLGFSDDGIGAFEGRMECSSPVPSGALVLVSRKMGGVLRMTAIVDASKSQLADNDDGSGAEDEMIGNNDDVSSNSGTEIRDGRDGTLNAATDVNRGMMRPSNFIGPCVVT